MTLIFWAAGNFLFDAAGVGAMLEPLPPAFRLLIYLIDVAFVTAFFAACLHFAIVFTRDVRRPVPIGWQVLAWLLPLPIFFEALPAVLRRVEQSPRSFVPASDAIYQILGPALLVAALVILGIRFTRTIDLNARRRLQLIFIALLPGVVCWIAADVISNSTDSLAAHQIGSIINQLGTIASSAIFVYAVVRHRMYNIRFLVRRSIQYAFARGTLFVAMSLPAVGLAIFLWAHRNESLASLLTGTPAVYVIIILPLVLIARFRRPMLDALDRRYFREQYDARHLLLHVVSMIRDGSDIFGLSRVALDEIERALHPKHMSLWRLDAKSVAFEREFVRGDASDDAPPLANSGALPALLASNPEPLDLYARASRALRTRLPAAEGEWIARTNAYLLVPLLIENRLVGLMLLGERMSEEPYSREDRDLLRTLATQLALTFDYSRLRTSPSLVWTPAARTPLPISDELWSCMVCGRCYPSEAEICEADHQRLVREEGVPRTIEDKYVITRILGRGGMGSVYLATQTRLNRPVAVKVLLSHLVNNPSMRERFEREARIVARMRHPAIVTIHDFGVLPSNHAYLVMEYLEGDTLRKTIRSGAQPLPRTLEIMRPVCDAVDTAHKAGVVHRDLKPENVMVLADRTPRVLDFGLAKMTGPIGDDEATMVQSGQSIGIVGTLMYLAPEVLGGKPADARSDQYSLGVITYELISGAHPFAGANDLAAIVRAHTEQPVPPLRHASPRVAEAVQRALAKDARERFGSVAEFVGAIG
jgi:predicted Ser/Thr protein kinase